MGTLTRSDLYPFAKDTPKAEPSSTQAASGKLESGPVNGPAFSWLAMVIVLVALRVVYEFAPVGD